MIINKESSSEEKRKRILASALQEFSEHGYAICSTNVITEKAEVSKGLLFHMFHSKKQLYLYLVNMCIIELREYLLKLNINNLDFFQMISCYSQGKLMFYINNLSYYKLLCEAFYNTPKEVEKEITDLYKTLSDSSYALIYEQFQKESLRENIDRNKALELIIMTFNSLEKKYINLILNSSYSAEICLNEMSTDFLDYLDLLKKGIK